MYYLSDRLANAAFNRSCDSNFNSPFAVKARDSGINYKGGKPDDISVIAARVICY
jgi:hypothetical protein